jgi:hypothetical protein
VGQSSHLTSTGRPELKRFDAWLKQLRAREASLVSAEEGDRRAEELVVTAATTKRNHETLIAISNYPKVSELVRSLQYC